jgi:uncharacterized coiled-coil DUF342 family protein
MELNNKTSIDMSAKTEIINNSINLLKNSTEILFETSNKSSEEIQKAFVELDNMVKSLNEIEHESSSSLESINKIKELILSVDQKLRELNDKINELKTE